MAVVFSSAGKAGDACHQFAVPFWFHRETGKRFSVWLDQETCKPLVPLFAAQPGVDEVILRGGIDNWTCGGQPWHFNLATQEMLGHEIHHLGFRSFPQRQISLETRYAVPLKLKVDSQTFADTPHLVVPDLPQANRLVIHAMGVCPHNKQTPQVWKFLAGIRAELEDMFSEIVFVGTPNERAVGLDTYPAWKDWADDGDFLKLGSYLKASGLVIAAGSSVAALAGALRVPCIRVHDQIQNLPKVIFSNLGPQQLNATEIELRREWPKFKANLNAKVAV